MDIGAEIEANLKHDLQECDFFSIALDETTDICDVAQLIFWVRYVKNGQIHENMLALVPLTEQTRACDIFDAFMKVVARFNLDLSKLASVCFSEGVHHRAFQHFIVHSIPLHHSSRKFVRRGFGNGMRCFENGDQSM